MKVKSLLYIDNCATSVNSVVELNTLREESPRILKKKDKFDPRGRKNNFLSEIGKTVTDVLGITEVKGVSVLDLAWDRKKDTLSCEHIKANKDNGQTIKRKILSIVQKIFDSRELTCPVTLLPKLLLKNVGSIRSQRIKNCPIILFIDSKNG
ncbi:integrase catalytic domain-containing protein [Trichonephila clavata]|uniref:Integrase catalytic domain-containing protein n=1 Tax=Trichonephila clavata TaxID=2740835 RepID=A0A8X6LS65_TRICU|nr:integrase catalytic domain-containing protein [Trichonephila clavata]